MILLSECVVRVPCVTMALTLKSGHWAVERDPHPGSCFPDHYMQVLVCHHECVRELATRPGRLSPIENFLPLHYDYLQFAYYRGKAWIICEDLEGRGVAYHSRHWIVVSWPSAFLSCNQEIGVGAFSLSPHVTAAQNKSRRWNCKCTNVVTMPWKLYCIDILCDF